jgi:hypothetical protein
MPSDIQLAACVQTTDAIIRALAKAATSAELATLMEAMTRDMGFNTIMPRSGVADGSRSYSGIANYAKLNRSDVRKTMHA